MGVRDLLRKERTFNELAGRLGRALSRQVPAERACSGPERSLIGRCPSQSTTAQG
jgi:hypothetical protein